MCVNYDTPNPQQLMDRFDVEAPAEDWRSEVWQDYPAPIIIERAGKRQAVVASYGMLPKDKQPPGKHYTTMNARSETVGQLQTYKRAWSAGQLCLVPLTAFYEPHYFEEKKSVRWRISLHDGRPFAVAGVWRSWDDGTDQVRYSFTQLTVNADDHAFMRNFHKWNDEKRSLVILPEDDWDAWLACRNPELARAYLQLYPSELMAGEPKPVPPRKKVTTQQELL